MRRWLSTARRFLPLPAERGEGPPPSKLRRAFTFLARTVAALILLPPVIWWLAVHLGSYPRARLEPRAAASLTVVDAAGTILRQDATAAGGRETWVPLDQISPHLINATLASEDRRFWKHAGVDPVGIARAVALDLARGRAAFGGSTLTMQLSRLVEPHPRNLWWKMREAVAAGRLERAFGKREILEQYLNRVYYGHAAWGAEAAARFYFAKPAAALSLGEAAFLAVLPRGPEVYDPFKDLPLAMRRRAHILGEMQEAGLIDAGARDVAEKTPLAFNYAHPELRAPHFVEHVLAGLSDTERAGVTIETTLDSELQRRLELAVRDHLDVVGGRGISQAGLVVLRNSDGAILAMVGSRNYFDAAHAGAVNVTTIPRRPGSTLKPFVYALALEAGDSPATLAYDLVLPGENHETYTAEVKQHGVARYRESLAGSYNLAAVHTLQRVGVPALVDRLRAAGLTTLTRPEGYKASLAIGEAEFEILEYAGAFAAFGNGGRAVVPRAVRAVRGPGPGGARRILPPAEGAQVFSPEVAYLIFDILSDPHARRPMFGSSAPMDVGFKIALKTGTTRAYTDDLAFGTTREFTVGAWAGNFDGTPTAGVMAMQGAAPMVRAAFVALAARYGTPSAPDEPRDRLEHADVCALTGLRPGPDCPHKHETFTSGTAPTRTCDWHRRIDGKREVVWPSVVEGWARAHRLSPGPRAAVSTALEIVYPSAGAHFLLDPGRPATQQLPPLRTLPARPDVQWTVDGVAADDWVATRGPHVLTARLAGQVQSVEVQFE